MMVIIIQTLSQPLVNQSHLHWQYHDRENPVDKHVMALSEVAELEAAPMAPQLFGNAGLEHMKKYGTTPLHLAKIAHKNHKHSTNNPWV